MAKCAICRKDGAFFPYGLLGLMVHAACAENESRKVAIKTIKGGQAKAEDVFVLWSGKKITKETDEKK